LTLHHFYQGAEAASEVGTLEVTVVSLWRVAASCVESVSTRRHGERLSESLLT
jgi:hypothetical protein